MSSPLASSASRSSENYQAFLQRIMDQTTEYLFLIHDGARYHTSASTQVLRIIAAITHELVITRILRHLKLASAPPPIAPARCHQEIFAFN